MGLRSLGARAGALVVLALFVGALAALVWANVTEVPAFLVQSDGHATISEPGLAQVFSSDWWFSVLGVVGGLVLGVASWALLRRVGWPAALAALGLGLGAGVTCWLLGEVIGPGAFASRMAAAQAGELVPISLELRSPSALAVWGFVAVGVPLFASALGPELGGDEEPRLRRRRLRLRAAELDAGEPVD